MSLFKKYFLFIVIISINTPRLIFSDDFENNFLQTYLNLEKAFLEISGDYGTNFFPFLNMSYGGRDVGFSGAFTAVADDINTIESNPAGTSSLDYTELFFSHSKILGDVNYNTLAFTMRFNDLGVGFGSRVLYIPFDRYDNFGDITGSGVINYSVYTFNVAYNFFRNYDFFGLSIGANIKLFVYGVPDTIISNQTSVGVVFDFGILSRFNLLKGYSHREFNFSIGFAARNLGPFVQNEPPPTSLSIGIAYKPIYTLLMSVDFEMLINYTDLTYKNWCVRSGVEWYFTPFTALLCGFAIKSNPSFSLGMNIRFDDFNITVIYNPDFSDLFKFSVSASIKMGDFGRKDKFVTISNQYLSSVRLMNQGKYSEAIPLLENILFNDRTFTPALRSLELCKRHLRIQQEIEGISNLNTSLN